MNRRRLRITWSANLPSEVRAAFEPHLERWSFLIPGWVEELRVGWDSSGDSTEETAVLSARPMQEYRYVKIDVFPGFLDVPESDRSEDVLHELVHIPIHPVVEVLDALVTAVKPGDAAECFAREQIRRAMEGAVCDVTAMILAASSQPAAAA